MGGALGGEEAGGAIQEMAHFYPRGRKDGHLAKGQETLAEFSRSPLTKTGLDKEGKLLFIKYFFFKSDQTVNEFCLRFFPIFCN